MTRTMSATEARVHFGELIRIAKETGEHILVEKSGEPVLVVMSPESFQRQQAFRRSDNWLENARRSAHRIGVLLDGRPLPDIDEMINAGHGDDDEFG